MNLVWKKKKRFSLSTNMSFKFRILFTLHRFCILFSGAKKIFASQREEHKGRQRSRHWDNNTKKKTEKNNNNIHTINTIYDAAFFLFSRDF